jgi:hypothetical protein
VITDPPQVGERGSITTIRAFDPTLSVRRPLFWGILAVSVAASLLRPKTMGAFEGSAEDVFAGILVRTGNSVSFTLGYRILEGGTDSDEVCAFTLVHYLSAGRGV